MKRTIVTISRQYGSGGRLVGEKVAAALNIPFYNHNLIDLVAYETGLASEYIANWEEQISSPRLWGVPVFGGIAPPMIEGAYYTNEDRMFAAQSKIIKDIASKGSAVIVGRLADYLLADDPDLLSVYVYADEKVRTTRIWKEYGARDENEAMSNLKAIDKNRAAYIRKYAQRDWDDYKNYHLMINSGRFGIEKSAATIVTAVRG